MAKAKHKKKNKAKHGKTAPLQTAGASARPVVVSAGPSRSTEQKRSAYAWKRVTQHHGTISNGFSDYVNLAKGAPALIMGSGLMQTLAFYQAKGREHHKALLDDVLTWLHTTEKLPVKNFKKAMEFMAEFDSVDYQCATLEALEILRWIRQLADAVKQLSKEESSPA